MLAVRWGILIVRWKYVSSEVEVCVGMLVVRWRYVSSEVEVC